MDLPGHGGRADAPEASAGDASGRPSQVDVGEQVEGIGPELQVSAFPERKALHHAEIQVHDTVPEDGIDHRVAVIGRIDREAPGVVPHLRAEGFSRQLREVGHVGDGGPELLGPADDRLLSVLEVEGANMLFMMFCVTGLKRS